MLAFKLLADNLKPPAVSKFPIRGSFFQKLSTQSRQRKTSFMYILLTSSILHDASVDEEENNCDLRSWVFAAYTIHQAVILYGFTLNRVTPNPAVYSSFNGTVYSVSNRK